MVIICIMLINIWCFSCLFDYAPTTRLLASWIQEFILFHAVPQCPEQCLVHSKVSIHIHVLNESIHIPNHFTSLLKPLAASRCPPEYNTHSLPWPCEIWPLLASSTSPDPPSSGLLLRSSYPGLSIQALCSFQAFALAVISDWNARSPVLPLA